MSAVLQVDGLPKSFGGVQAVARRHLRRRRRRAAGADRPQRRRQDHLLQHAERPARARRRHACGSTAATSSACARARIWRLGVGRTFQITATFASMTVRENVQMALYPPRRPAALAAVALRRGASRREADALLDQVGMLDQAERPCGVLAYGDLKRVELAIALANPPRLLLMDEPTAGMAPRERVALMELAARHRARAQHRACCSPSTTWTSCSATPTASSCSTAAELIAGGTPAEVRANPGCAQVYLGERAPTLMLAVAGSLHVQASTPLRPRADPVRRVARGRRPARSSPCSAATAPASRRR